MIELRAPRGLGDAIYLRAVVLHLLDRGEQVKVYTKWPTAFGDLPIELAPFDDAALQGHVRPVAAGMGRPNSEGVSNFTARCRRAGIEEPVELRLGWKTRDTDLVRRVRKSARGRPIMLYQSPKKTNTEEQELIKPHRLAFNAYLESKADHFRVRLGQAPYVENDRYSPCELDLFGQIEIPDVFDLATICDFAFGEPSALPFMAEACDTRYAIMFSRRSLEYTGPLGNGRIRNINPERLFHKPHLAEAVYDE